MNGINPVFGLAFAHAEEISMNIQQLIALGGMIGPILYTMIWILDGILQPGYNHIRDDVSSLLAVGASNKRLFDIMRATDVILVIIFFSTLHWAIDGGQGLIIGPACFLLANLIELVVALFYPLDEGGEMKSSRAKMHWNLVRIMAILAMVGMLAMWYRLSSISGWECLGTYSLITFIVSAVTGLWASRNVGTKIMGLTERLVVTTNAQIHLRASVKRLPYKHVVWVWDLKFIPTNQRGHTTDGGNDGDTVNGRSYTWYTPDLDTIHVH